MKQDRTSHDMDRQCRDISIIRYDKRTLLDLISPFDSVLCIIFVQLQSTNWYPSRIRDPNCGIVLAK